MGKPAGEQMGVVSALVRGSFLVNAVYAASSREYGLTPQQGQLLCVLMSGPFGMGELGAMLGLAKSSLTGLVDRCAQRGLVRRETDPRDARGVQVTLTAEGSEIVEDFYAETCRRVEALTTSLGEDQRRALADALGRLVEINEVPVVFMELNEAPPATHSR
jgi:DNA-binding MarR family transcriptional regulator